MPDDLEIVKAEGHLRIIYSGPFSSAAVRDSVGAMLAVCTREKCAKVLFDCRPMTGEMTVLDRFEAGEYGASTIPPSMKIAMLGREDQILPDRFFENVVRARGLDVAVFSDADEAIEWLRETASDGSS